MQRGTVENLEIYTRGTCNKKCNTRLIRCLELQSLRNELQVRTFLYHRAAHSQILRARKNYGSPLCFLLKRKHTFYIERTTKKYNKKFVKVLRKMNAFAVKSYCDSFACFILNVI